MAASYTPRRRAAVGTPGMSCGISSSFYFLSALMMMVGCYTLAHSLDLRVGAVQKLLAVLVVLNLYEALLIGLGAYLIVHRRVVRDGVLLLVLELLFLFDASYLNTESTAASGSFAALCALLVALLTAGKVFAVAYTLGIQPPLGLSAIGGAGLLALAGTPAWLTWRSLAGELDIRDIYIAWWVVGLIGGAHGALLVHSRVVADRSPTKRTLCAAFWIGLYVSLFGHLLALGWVYRLPMHESYLAPVVLALTPWTQRWDWRPAWRFAMLAMAVLLSLGFPQERVGQIGSWPLSPLRLTLLAAGLCYGWL